MIAAPAFKTSDYAAMIEEVRAELPALEQVVLFDSPEWESLAGGADAELPPCQFDDPINIQYTSGTTGFPKGATLSHANILNNGYFVAEGCRYTEEDRVCIPVPFYHCFGMVMGNLGATTHGACMVIASGPRQAVSRSGRARLPLPGVGVGGARGGVHGHRRQAVLPGRAPPRRCSAPAPSRSTAGSSVAGAGARQGGARSPPSRGSAVIGAIISLPVLPADSADPAIAVNEDVAETIGWPELAETVAEVYRALPDARRAVILAGDYGEAGAIDRFGPDLGLPRAYSGHNAYFDWGPPPAGGAPVIAVGGPRRDLAAHLRDCTVAARIDNDAGVDNDEQGTPVMGCRGPRGPWSRQWPGLRRLG